MTSDRERLADADHVIHGPDGARMVRKVLYAIYVTAVLALTYAFTVLQAVLVSTDTQWIRDNLAGWRGPALGALTLVLALAGAWWLGGRRGPATAPLPWLDLVAGSSIDRALTLGPWWRAALVGITGCAAILGGVLGAAVYAAGLAPPPAILLGVAGGAGLAVLACWTWLLGQVAASGGRPDRGAPGIRALLRAPGTGTLLRALAMDELRAHARRGQRLYGAVLAGDPRAARLEVSHPIRRGRGLRLRPGGPLAAYLRRDVLGLRRQPGVALVAALLAAIGATVTTLTVLDPTTPVVLTALGVAFCHLAIGQWSQGLRFASDGLSAPALLGGSVVRRALGHSIVPAVAFALVALPVAAAWSLALGATVPRGLLVAALTLALVPMLVGGHWWSAFRVPHPDAAFLPELGPFLLAFAVARPWLVVLAGGTAALQRIDALPSAWLGVALLLLVGLATVWRGRTFARRLVAAGR